MSTPAPVALRRLGGPTVVLDWAGLTVVSDPTFDPPGEYPGPVVLRKTAPPSEPADALGRVDLVLVSHDQHADNLDGGGRALLGRAGHVLSTPAAAGRIAGVTGLEPWASTRVPLPGGGSATVTATPARHGPPGTEDLTGPVTGFHLAADGWPSVYLTGDTVDLDGVRRVRQRLGPVDLVVAHAGAARVPGLDTALTLTAEDVVEVARAFDPAAVLAVHVDGWAHFTQTHRDVEAAMAAAGLADRLVTG